MDQMPTRAEPRVHYLPWRGVRVTDVMLTVGDRQYAIRQLRQVRVRPGRQQQVRRVVVGIAIAQALVVAAALAALVVTNGWSVAIYVLGIAQGLFTTGLMAVAVAKWPRPAELWAIYRGEATMLYRGSDRFEFGKIKRAVDKAIAEQRLLK